MNSTRNTVLLELDNKYTEEIILEGGLKLYIDPSYKPEWNATVTGMVSAVPVFNNTELKVGDKVYFSYHVVSDRKFGSDMDFFLPNIEGEYYREYQDKNDNIIKVVAFDGAITKHWAGVLYNKFGELINGVQGRESEIERWLSQFKFGRNDEMVYKNLIEVNGKDYWVCDTPSVFAKVVDDKIQALGGYTICSPIKADITQQVNLTQKIQLPPNTIVMTLKDYGLVVTTKGADLEVKEGDIVLFDGQFAMKYTFDGKEYLVVPNHRLLSKKV